MKRPSALRLIDVLIDVAGVSGMLLLLAGLWLTFSLGPALIAAGVLLMFIATAAVLDARQRQDR